MDLSLFFAGTAGSVPTPKRGLPALLLRAGGERILLDCGEGTQHQLLRSNVGLPEVDAIFITHLHLDHWMGLPGLIKTFDMRDRDRRLDVYGPPGLGTLFNTVLRPVIGRSTWLKSAARPGGPKTSSRRSRSRMSNVLIIPGSPSQ